MEKKLISRFMLVAALAAAAVASPACSSSPDDSGDATDQELSAPGGRFGPALFRDDFYTYLKNDGHLSDEQVKELVLMPTQAALTPQVGAVDPANPLKGYDAAYARLRPMDFYQQGLTTPLTMKTGFDGGPVTSELRRNPVHIVVVPGIFGEFIPVSPFEEVFDYGGAASVKWDQKMKALEADHANDTVTHDRQYSAAALGDVQKSMRDLVRVGSIDDSDGTPLVTITYLKPALGSLETFGTLDENADYYLTRLDKYFKIIGMPDHLYMMGYSRGTPVALNLLSRGTQENASWAPHMKGMITLAGVIYGSQLADVARGSGPEKDLLDIMTDFVQNELQSCDSSGTPSLGLMTENLGHWVAFAAREGLAASKMGNENDALKREGIDTSNADVGKMVSFARRVLFGDPQNVFTDTDDSSAMLGVLHLTAPNAEYCQNIDRFKKSATQLMKGIDTLTTQSRLDWFHTHTLPTSVHYYSITGTMGDETPVGAQPTPLVADPAAYDIHSQDFKSLRTNYYDMFNASQNQLSDSQVTVARAHFWPELASVLNPNQAPIKTYFMGTVGIHHWGLSFPRAFSTKDGTEANPFPRTLFLKSIGTFVAQVESRGG